MTDYYGIDYIIHQKEIALKERKKEINYLEIELRSLKRMQETKKVI